ncbi:MAG: type II toxin-antitoxin system VapC family toxin [Gemmatimonadaceae bacterium]
MTNVGACLDTDVCVDLMRGARARNAGAFASLPRSVLWMSTITLAELEFGVSIASHPGREATRLSWLREFVTVRPFDARAAAISGVVRGALERQGTRIGKLDALIAAHALAEGAVLLTRNVREFSRIQGLTIAEV